MRGAAGSRLTTAIILAAMLTGASAAAARTHAARTHAQRGLGALIPKTKGERLPTHGGTADSLNWSGYAVTPAAGGITAVSSTFTVPSAGLAPPGFAATWTGIGGYNTSDLIQAGTAEVSAPSNPLLGDQYYAWYELLPASETQITGCTGDANCTVTPGDNVSVNISQVSGDTWSISDD
jgi:Peptidase A4 family